MVERFFLVFKKFIFSANTFSPSASIITGDVELSNIYCNFSLLKSLMPRPGPIAMTSQVLTRFSKSPL